MQDRHKIIYTGEEALTMNMVFTKTFKINKAATVSIQEVGAAAVFCAVDGTPTDEMESV